MIPGGPVFARMSFAPAGDSWRKRTLLDEAASRQTGFFAQSSFLSTQSLICQTPEH
jgi:hypothetical protein